MREFSVLSLDFVNLITEARILAARLLPEWEFDDQADPVRFLLELYLRSVDRATFFTNAIGQEFSLSTAVDRRSVIAHAKRLGFIPPTRQPASTQLLLTVTPAGVPRTILPYSVAFSTIEQEGEPIVTFENQSTITIPATIAEISATFVEGQTFNEVFVLEGVPFELVVLSRAPVLREEVVLPSIIVTIGGEEWEVVQGFGDSGPTDKHVKLDIDPDGIGSLRFGDNINGEIPLSGASLAVRYRIGGGTRGNVTASKVTVIQNAPDYVTAVTNVSSSSGGVDDPPLVDIKQQAPLFISTGGQLNTETTVKNAIESTASVARAKVTRFGNRLTSQILTEQGFNAANVIDSIRASIESRLLMGFTLDLISPNFIEVEVSVRVFAFDNVNVADVEDATRTQIDRWLNPLAKDAAGNFINDFGVELRRSTLLQFLGELVEDQLIFDYEVLLPETNVTVGVAEMITNTHQVTPEPLIEVVGGQQTAGFTDPRQLINTGIVGSPQTP